jgi:hypothetical protein
VSPIFDKFVYVPQYITVILLEKEHARCTLPACNNVLSTCLYSSF